MIELYGSGSPNVTRIFIALEELSLPYRAHGIDIFAGQQFEDWFGQINPNRKVPVIVDRNDQADERTIFESAAILIYLSDKTRKLLPASGQERYETLQWLMVQVTTVGPMMGQYVHFSRYAPEASSRYALDRYRTQAQRVFDVLDNRLEARANLAGDDISIADIALFPWCRNLSTLFGEDYASTLTNINRWKNELSCRPSVIRALAAQDVLRQRLTTPENAQSEMLDRLFGRGEVVQN
ncbi:glutathione S-transferase family protein [Agrobacterium tumefaciens]|uniref:glutathione S-transferase family protein n=2 Tax=Agrobacterium tumefaciens TaxID=358 RepID=UPI003BA19ADB